MDARASQLQVNQDRVVRELASVGFSDIRKLFDDKGNLKPLHELDEDTAACISSIKVRIEVDGETVFFIKEIEFCDKNRALEELGRHLKLFTDRMESDVAWQFAIRSAVPELQPLPTEFLTASSGDSD